jgi:hypothetical protein
MLAETLSQWLKVESTFSRWLKVHGSGLKLSQISASLIWQEFSLCRGNPQEKFYTLF